MRPTSLNLKGGGIFFSSPLSPFCYLECIYEGWSSSSHLDSSNRNTLLEQWKPETFWSLRTLWNAISILHYIMGFNERDFYVFLSLSLVGEILNHSQLYLIPTNTIAFSTKLRDEQWFTPKGCVLFP